MTQQTVPLLLEAQTYGPAAATGNQEERRGGRSRLGRRQSGRIQRQTSNLTHTHTHHRHSVAISPDHYQPFLSQQVRFSFQLRSVSEHFSLSLRPDSSTAPDSRLNNTDFGLITETTHTSFYVTYENMALTYLKTN